MGIDSETYDFGSFSVEGEETENQPSSKVMVSDPSVMSEAEFYTNFKGMFNFSGALTGLESLPIADSEAGEARAASNAIYASAKEVSWLRFLIDKNSTWLGRILAIGMFTVPKAMTVKAEIAFKIDQAEKAESEAVHGEA